MGRETVWRSWQQAEEGMVAIGVAGVDLAEVMMIESPELAPIPLRPWERREGPVFTLDEKGVERSLFIVWHFSSIMSSRTPSPSLSTLP